MKNIAYIFILLVFFSCKSENHNSIISTESKTDILPNSSSKSEVNAFDIRTANSKELFETYFKSNSLDSLFLISYQINPNKYIADFNGDNKDDIVFFVKHIKNNKNGLIFFHSNSEYYVVGGGNKSSVFEDIAYTEFSIDMSKVTYETVIDSVSGDIIEPKRLELKNIALDMHEEEGTSGILTWNGKKYIYIHTGD